MTGSSARITPSCARRPRSRSDADRGAPQAGAPRMRHYPSYPGDAPMNINVSRWQTLGGLAVAALLAGMIAVGLSNPSPAGDPPAPKADEFSQYVAKDGGISLPADYREKFLHLGTYAVATKPDKPVDEMHNVYARPEDVQAY